MDVAITEPPRDGDYFLDGWNFDDEGESSRDPINSSPSLLTLVHRFPVSALIAALLIGMIVTLLMDLILMIAVGR